MNNIIDRLVKYMNHKGLNPNKITVEAGLSVGLIGKAIKAKKGLHSDTIEKILQTYSDLDAYWFVLGKGEMIIIDEIKQPVDIFKLDVSSEPILYSESELVKTLKETVTNLRKDIEDLKDDKELLKSIVKTKLGKANAS